MNDNIKFQFVNWVDVVGLCNSIYEKMVADCYKPDIIVGLLRGGIIPARILCDLLGNDVNLFTIDIKLYNGIGERSEKPIIQKFEEDLIRGKKICIVDDVIDSYVTMNAILNHLSGENIKTATLHCKKSSKIRSDYYGEIVDDDKWLVYEWERHEFARETKIRSELC